MSPDGTQQLEPICFVIMPFAVRESDLPRYHNDPNHWTEVYRGLIAPAVRKAGLRVERDDDDYSTRLVGEGIWRKIEEADLVLCDMSSHNPNVHLELGWAMRSNRRLVLIKDDITSFNFDLNQYFTCEYGSRLQPTALAQSIEDLSRVIRTTLAADVLRYSMVAKLELKDRATARANEGSLEVELLQQLLAEVQSFKWQSPAFSPQREDALHQSLDVVGASELAVKLVGSTWRKQGGLEDVLFDQRGKFLYHSVGMTEWLQNDYRYDAASSNLVLTWRHDGYVAHCRFDHRYSRFIEVENGAVWQLVAKGPYRHPSFGPPIA